MFYEILYRAKVRLSTDKNKKGNRKPKQSCHLLGKERRFDDPEWDLDCICPSTLAWVQKRILDKLWKAAKQEEEKVELEKRVLTTFGIGYSLKIFIVIWQIPSSVFAGAVTKNL